MHDAGQLVAGFAHLGDDALDVGLVSHIAAQEYHINVRIELGAQRPRRRVIRTAAAHEREAARSPCHQPLRGDQAERTETAGDQERLVRAELGLGVRSDEGAFLEVDHDLADVRAPAEHPERLLDLVEGVARGGDRRD